MTTTIQIITILPKINLILNAMHVVKWVIIPPTKSAPYSGKRSQKEHHSFWVILIMTTHLVTKTTVFRSQSMGH